MDKLDIALIGCGGISYSHVIGYRELHTHGLSVFNIKAVCDVSERKAKTRAEEIGYFQGYKPRLYNNIDEMLKNESLEAVDICLPHSLHHTVATECLGRGLHIIIEKPLGITMRAARLIIDSVEKNGKTLAVAENYRRTPENRAIWWAIRNGLVGKPRMLLWISASWWPEPWGWREDKFMAGGSWVFDGGVHFADLDRYQLGVEAVEVYSMNELFEPVKKGVKITVDDMTMAMIRYEKGIYAQWLWTRVAPAKNVSMRVIYGSIGALSNDGLHLRKESKTEHYDMIYLRKMMTNNLTRDKVESMFPKGITDTFATELYDFYLSVRDGRKPEVDGWEAYRDMAIPLAFYESALLNEPVKVRDVEELRVEEYQKEINEKLGIK